MFARREAKTRIRQRDWLKLAGEKIRREQVGSVPTFLSVRANKFAWWKTGLRSIKADFHSVQFSERAKFCDRFRHVVKRGLDWTCKTRTGLKFVKRELDSNL